MLSILGKLLCNELGETNYDIYFKHYSLYVNNISDDNNIDRRNEQIFYDIYCQLKEKDIYVLQEMLERLLEAIELTVRISRQYVWVWLATVTVVLFFVLCPVSGLVTLLGISVVLTGFIYKSIVFIVNRYCFIDANIVLLYKTALYHVILTYDM